MPRSQRVIDGDWAPREGAQFDFAVAGGQGLTVPSDAQAAVIQAEGDVRYSDDPSTPPDNGSGMLLADGGSMLYTGTLSDLVFEEDVATSGAAINVLYYGWPD